MYTLFWRSPGLPYIQKQNAITVGPGAIVSTAASVRLTGVGAANYGRVQQENLLRVLENFAGPTEPDHPTVGQTWYDTDDNVLKVCVRTRTDTDPAPPAVIPAEWRSLNSMQISDVGDPPPSAPVLGDTWFSRRGPLSGVMYTYTGVGRYPQVDWDASTYYPPTSTTLAAQLNTQTFNGTLNYGEAYIHGFSGVTPANVSGTILVDGSPVAIGPEAINTRFAGSHYVIYDESGTFVNTGLPVTPFFAARRLDNGQWQYDNNTEWVNFTAADTPGQRQLVIGTITVGIMDNDVSPGVTDVTIWSAAISASIFVPAPASLTNGAIGGWSQVWPSLDVIAGRKEYDYVLGLVLELIGEPTSLGGSGAYGRLVNYLTNFNALDASLRVALQTNGPDEYVALTSTDIDQLKVDVNSQDWDKLLAAARWAIQRYELPNAMLDDISPVPFVMDGLPADPVINTLSTSILNARDERRSMTRLGSLTMMRYYQETVNVLNAAKAKRYTLRGMLGSSGTNVNFNPGVTSTVQAAFTLNASTNQLTTARTNGLKYRFATNDHELRRFFTSGQAIEVILTYSPGGSPTASDTELANACTARGRMRVTFDSTYVMSTAPNPTLAAAPGTAGFSSIGTSSPLVLATGGVGGATISLSGQGVSNNSHHVDFNVTVQTSGSTTGTLTVTWRWINDSSTYVDELSVVRRLYPEPLAYNAGTDKLGFANFV